MESSINVSSGRVPARNYLSTHVGGVAQSLRRTLVWTYVPSPNLAANTYQEYVIVVNSPYDPDNAVGGSSAVGFAKYMALYTKCFTLGARIKTKSSIASGSTFGSPLGIVTHGMTITTFTTSLGSAAAAIGTGLCDYGVTSNSPDNWKHELSVDIGKFLDKPQVLDDPELFCTGSSNPTQVICAHVWWFAYSAATIASTLTIEVEFDCVFTDPQPFT